MEYLFTGPTQLKKQLFIGDSDMAASKPVATAAPSVVEGHITDLTISQDPKKFPLECNKVALHWLDVSTRCILTVSIVFLGLFVNGAFVFVARINSWF